MPELYISFYKLNDDDPAWVIDRWPGTGIFVLITKQGKELTMNECKKVKNLARAVGNKVLNPYQREDLDISGTQITHEAVAKYIIDMTRGNQYHACTIEYFLSLDPRLEDRFLRVTNQ